METDEPSLMLSHEIFKTAARSKRKNRLFKQFQTARQSTRWPAPAIIMAPATTPALVTAITVTVRATSPTTIMAAASGSGSVSGTATAGGFAACGSAADPVHLR